MCRSTMNTRPSAITIRLKSPPSIHHSIGALSLYTGPNLSAMIVIHCQVGTPSHSTILLRVVVATHDVSVGEERYNGLACFSLVSCSPAVRFFMFTSEATSRIRSYPHGLVPSRRRDARYRLEAPAEKEAMPTPKTQPNTPLQLPSAIAGRVGAPGCPGAPLTEPDLWASHPALRRVIPVATRVARGR